MRLIKWFFWIPAYAAITVSFAAELNIRHIEPYGTAFTIKETSVTLPQEDFLEDSLFKVVLGRGEQLSEEPQEMTPNTYHISDWEEFVPNKTGWFHDRVARVSDKNLDAENVFYYLHVAQNSLLERFGERLRGLKHPQMIVRVGMASGYNMYLKFSDEETYNGAVTVGDPALDGPGIWFYLPKRIPKESFLSWSPLHKYLFKNTALMTEVPAFDSAKIAEVIFHEYGHVVTAPYLGVSFGSPVREGIADFLTSLISGDRIIADIKPFNPDWYLGPPHKYTHDLENGCFEDFDMNMEGEPIKGSPFVSSLLCELQDFLPAYLLNHVFIRGLEIMDGRLSILGLARSLVFALREVSPDLASLYVNMAFVEKPVFKQFLWQIMPEDMRTEIFNNSPRAGTIINTLENKPLEGIIEDQGKYFGRLGTHKLTLKDGSVMYMRRQPGNEKINLYKYCGSEKRSAFTVSGHIKIEQGLWSKNHGLVLEVAEIH